MRTVRALAVVLLLVVGVSACGSDDGGSVTSKASGSSSGSSGSEDYSKGGTDTDAGAAGSGTAVDIKDFSFSPKTLKVKAGDEVTITNDDSTEHTFTLDDGSYDSGHITAGSSTKHTFDKAGSYSYHCEIHSTMKGTVEVS